MSYHAVSFESAHNTDHPRLRQCEINILASFFTINALRDKLAL